MVKRLTKNVCVAITEWIPLNCTVLLQHELKRALIEFEIRKKH